MIKPTQSSISPTSCNLVSSNSYGIWLLASFFKNIKEKLKRKTGFTIYKRCSFSYYLQNLFNIDRRLPTNLIKIIALVAASIFCCPLYGQRIPDLRGDDVIRGGSTLPEKERPQEDYTGDVDTFGVFSFYADNPNDEKPFSDSLLGNYFQQYDPSRKRVIDLQHLGTLGSAAQPMFYEPLLRNGFDIGLHQYDPYHIRAIDQTYRRLEKPYTNLSYTQIGEQSDSYFTGEFSRNFADGLNVNIDYRNITMVGEQNQFPNQKSRNTAIAMGLWYHSADDRYDGFLSYAANTIEQEDNGGLIRDPDPDAESSAQVFLNDAQTRHEHRELMYTHYYKFGGKPDTINGGLTRAFTLNHQISYLQSKYKFFDPFQSGPTSTDSLFYRDFLVDFRGTRFYLEHQKVENAFNLSTFRLQRQARNSAQRQKDLIEVGLVHTLHSFDMELGRSNVNNLFINGRIKFNPNDRLYIDTYGQLGLLDNVGDYRIQGELFLDLRSLGSLRLKAMNQLYSPNLLQEQFVVTSKELWQNDFNKTLETNLSATYSLEKLNFSVTGSYHLINNYIYFDTLGIARQTGTPLSILQLVIQKDFTVGNFHLDNVLGIQEITEDVLLLPNIFTKHSLYYGGKWFKVLNVRVGADIRLLTTYNASYYNPLTGQFQLSRQFSPTIRDRSQVDFYPAADAFLSMQVTRFRAFVKWENLYRLIQPEKELFYHVAYYPQWTGGLRIGLKWRFVN